MTAAGPTTALLPALTLDQLHAELWSRLDRDAKRALRLVSRRTREEADECVRALHLTLDKDDGPHGHPSTQACMLAAFPRVTSLTLYRDDKSAADTVSGDEVAELFRISAVESTQISELRLVGVHYYVQLALEELPERIAASLRRLVLEDCLLDEPVLSPLATCSTLTELSLCRVYLASGDVAESLRVLTQLRSLDLNECFCSYNFTQPSPFTFTTLEALSALTSLRVSLEVNDYDRGWEWAHAWIRASALTALASMPFLGQLRSLSLTIEPLWRALEFRSARAAFLPSLRQLTSLEHLALGPWLEVDDEVAEVFARMARLTSLEVGAFSLTRPQPLHRLRHFRSWAKLQTVPVQQLAWLLGGTSSICSTGGVLNLDVSPPSASEEQATYDQLLAVARALQQCPVTSVRMIWQALDAAIKHSTARLIKCVRPLGGSLVQLKLHNIYLHADAVWLMASSFPNLRDLDVRHGSIAGALTALHSLPALSSLALLHCWGARVQDLAQLCKVAQRQLKVRVCRATLSEEEVGKVVRKQAEGQRGSKVVVQSLATWAFDL